MTELHFRPAHELAQMVREKRISAVELLDHHLDRQARLDGSINAVIWKDAESARAAARAADETLASGVDVGPLHGVPGTVKEAFDLAGSPSTWGSVDLKDNIAEADSVVVQRYRDAGGVLYGKTNVPLKLIEWQSFNQVYGTTNNPWDISRTPGGSLWRISGGAGLRICGDRGGQRYRFFDPESGTLFRRVRAEADMGDHSAAWPHAAWLAGRFRHRGHGTAGAFREGPRPFS